MPTAPRPLSEIFISKHLKIRLKKLAQERSMPLNRYTESLIHKALKDEQASSNADLLDPVPDLLAALEWALSNINCEPFEWGDDENANAHEAALAAIAKVRAE